MANLWGVDYGKKLSGNTVVCKKQAMSVRFFQAEKRQDADAFLLDLMWQESPEQIFIDAPLSLPGVYCDGKNYDNYFFRRCDQQLGAMSPMFLGGVTARAMSLKDQAGELGVQLRETYPKGLAAQMRLKEYGYRLNQKYIEPCGLIIRDSSQLDFPTSELRSWHHVDALLALLSGIRHEQNLSYTFGDAREGLIFI